MSEKQKDRLSSAGELNEYIRVTTPGVWMVLLAFTVFVAGLVIWSIGGHLTTAVSAAAVVKDGALTLYIRDDDAGRVSPGMRVEIADTETTVRGVAAEGSVAGEVMNVYARSLIGVTAQEQVFVSEGVTELEDGAYNASIIVEDLNPITFLFGGGKK